MTETVKEAVVKVVTGNLLAGGVGSGVAVRTATAIADDLTRMGLLAGEAEPVRDTKDAVTDALVENAVGRYPTFGDPTARRREFSRQADELVVGLRVLGLLSDAPAGPRDAAPEPSPVARVVDPWATSSRPPSTGSPDEAVMDVRPGDTGPGDTHAGAEDPEDPGPGKPGPADTVSPGGVEDVVDRVLGELPTVLAAAGRAGLEALADAAGKVAGGRAEEEVRRRVKDASSDLPAALAGLFDVLGGGRTR